MSAFRCGACTLCCTLMRVAMDPPKPARETCRHCTAQGCAVYDDRPDVCQGFQCLWLASQRLPQHGLAPGLPSAMRPDRSGVVIDLNEAGTVIAHCERPASWKREPIRSWLVEKAGITTVILELPGGAQLLAGDGTVEDLCKIGVDPATNLRLYARASEVAAKLGGIAA